MASKFAIGGSMLLVLLLTILPQTAGAATWQHSPFRAQIANTPATGQAESDTPAENPAPFVQKKNIGKAALFSLILPGTGELYTGSWLRAIPFFAIELAGWATFAQYQSKGNKKTDEFEAYAGWRDNPNHFNYVAYLYAEYQVASNDSRNGAAPAFNGTFSQYRALPTWDDRISHLPAPFTHDIMTGDRQQFFEMIGKYFDQFAFGWDDTYSSGSGEIGESNPPDWSLGADDPNTVAYDGQSPHFFIYRDMRGKANDLYDISNIAMEVVLVNHILSALDAAFAARTFNRNLEKQAEPPKVGHLQLRYNVQPLNGDLARYLTLSVPLN